MIVPRSYDECAYCFLLGQAGKLRNVAVYATGAGTSKTAHYYYKGELLATMTKQGLRTSQNATSKAARQHIAAILEIQAGMHNSRATSGTTTNQQRASDHAA